MKSEVLRRILCAAGLVGYLSWTSTPPLQAAKSSTYDWCSESCGEEESCSLECENDGGGTITCGEYHDGPANGWCLEHCSDVCSIGDACGRECLQTGWATDCEAYNGGVCQNTCENVCSAMTSGGSESCLDNGGVWSTCEDYGQMVQCNDGICAPGETCVCAECAQFCFSGDLSPQLLAALPSQPGFNQTAVGEACEAVNLYEWNESVDCPDWSWIEGIESTNPMCAELNHARTEMSLIFGLMDELATRLTNQFSCDSQSTNSECVQAAEYRSIADDALAAYNNYNSIPCYIDLE